MQFSFIYINTVTHTYTCTHTWTLFMGCLLMKVPVSGALVLLFWWEDLCYVYYVCIAFVFSSLKFVMGLCIIISDYCSGDPLEVLFNQSSLQA